MAPVEGGCSPFPWQSFKVERISYCKNKYTNLFRQGGVSSFSFRVFGVKQLPKLSLYPLHTTQKPSLYIFAFIVVSTIVKHHNWY